MTRSSAGRTSILLVVAWTMAVAARLQAAAPDPEAGGEAVSRLLGAVFRAAREASARQPAEGGPPGDGEARDRAEKKVAEAKPPAAAVRAAADQRQQQIEQQAVQMEQFFQGPLQAELELVRRTCGSLEPPARKAIAAAGKDAVKATSRQFAAWQFGDQRKQRFDVRATMHAAVAAAVKPHAKPEEFAAYERAHAARQARRERAARTLIVAKLDQQLELSVAQRDAITAELEKRWEPNWLRELDDNGNWINNLPVAPDFVDKCIAPQLDERQRTEWKKWTQQAGAGRLGGHHFGWNFDGTVLQPDAWWTP